MIQENVITLLNNLYFRHRLSAQQYREITKRLPPSAGLGFYLENLTTYREELASSTLEKLQHFPAHGRQPSSNRNNYLSLHWKAAEEAISRQDASRLRDLCSRNEESLSSYLEQMLTQRDWQRNIRLELERQLNKNRSVLFWAEKRPQQPFINNRV